MTMPVYDEQSFDLSLISHFKKEVRDVIAVAVSLGWKMHVSSTNSVTIISHDEKKKYHFSPRRNSTSLNRIKKDLLKHGDPTLVELAHQHMEGTLDRESGIAALGILVDQNVTIERNEETHPLGASPVDMPQRKEAVQVPEPEAERVIVSEKPMMAKASEGKGYQSRVAIERHWSDGTVDYKCVDCEFTSENRLSIRGHRSGAGHEKRGAPSERFSAEVPNAASYAPRKERIEALAAHLLEALESGKTLEQIAEEVARTSLMWVHEQSRKGTRLASEYEPLTAEETLDKIRLLLGGSKAYDALAEKDEQIEVMRADAEACDEEMGRLRQRVEELESFVELATTLSRKDSA